MSKYDYLHALYQLLIPLDTDKRNKIMREVEDRFRDAEEDGQNETTVTKTLGSPRDYAKQFLPSEHVLTFNPDNITMESLSSNESIITKAPVLIAGLELATDPVEAIENEIEEVITKVDIETLQPTHYNQPRAEIKKVYTSPQAIPKNRVANHPIKIITLSFAMLLFNAVFVLGPFIAVWSIIIAFIASGFAIGISGIAILISGILSLPLSFMSLPIFMLNHPVLLFSFGFLLTGVGGLLTIAMIYAIRLFGYITLKYFGWNLSVIRGY